MLCAGIATAKVLGLNRSYATTISPESGVQNGTLAITIGCILSVSAWGTSLLHTGPRSISSLNSASH